MHISYQNNGAEIKWPPFCRRHFQIIFSMYMVVFRFKFYRNLLPRGPMYNKPTLVYIMDWCRIGAKPLSEPMMVYFTDAYMCHSANRIEWYRDNTFNSKLTWMVPRWTNIHTYIYTCTYPMISFCRKYAYNDMDYDYRQPSVLRLS